MPRFRARLGGEDGFSLIELIVVIVIMGVAFMVLVGGTLVGVFYSDVQRKTADADTVIRALAEEVKGAPWSPTCSYDPAAFRPNLPAAAQEEVADGDFLIDIEIDCQSVADIAGLQKIALTIRYPDKPSVSQALPPVETATTVAANAIGIVERLEMLKREGSTS